VSEPRDIFISHAGEDEIVVRTLADGLEREGYNTWYYERDSVFGEAHLIQTMHAIEQAKLILVVASPNSLRSHEVTSELKVASRKGKLVAPLLLGVTWDQATAKELWSVVFGVASALTINPDHVLDILPRMLTGLTAMGVVPSGGAASAKSISVEYPFPIAATYIQKLGRPWGPEQSVQAHEAIRDMVEAAVAYLAVIATCRYRREIHSPGREDLAVESVLGNLCEPGLTDWVVLLFSSLKAHVLASDPLATRISKFLDTRHDSSDAVSVAAVNLKKWIDRNAPPPNSVANRDFIDLLSNYARVQEGWGGSGTRLTGHDECQNRVDILRPAVERMLLDLSFLTGYPLVYVQDVQHISDRIWSHRIYDGMGRDLVVKNEQLQSHKPLERSHVYLCQRGEKSLQPLVDLEPLLVLQDCPTCGVPSMLLSAMRKIGRAEGVSLNCRHKTEWDDNRTHELATFLSLSDWCSSFLPTEHLPYKAAIEEVVFDNGQISTEERQKLEFLAKALRVPLEVTKRLEDQALADYHRQQTEYKAAVEMVIFFDGQISAAEKQKLESLAKRLRVPPEVAKRLEDQAFADYQEKQAEIQQRDAEARGIEKPGAQSSVQVIPPGVDIPPKTTPHEAPTPPTKQFLPVWQEGLESKPTHVALFAAPPIALAVDEAGEVTVHGRDGKLVFRDRVHDRAFGVAAAGARVFVTTWSGDIYCFGPREVLWHRHVGSPVSAIHVATGSLGLLAGTWDGRVLSLRSEDGSQQWTTSFEDGISALAAATDGSACFVGSYAGHVARLGPNGQKEWVRDMRAGVMQVAMTDDEGDMVVATRHGVLTQLQAKTQATVLEHFFESALVDVGFSGNRRRVSVALQSGKVQVCDIDGAVHVRTQEKFENVSQTAFSPLSSSGRFPFVVSRSKGLAFFDDQASGWNIVVEPPVACASISTEGRAVLVARTDHIELLRLAAPALTTKIVPHDALRKGHFTRLNIKVDNQGERPARDIKVELSGPMEGRTFTVDQELRTGAGAVYDNQSVQPKEDGAVPLRVRLTCVDDRGIEHVFESEHVLDVGAASAVKQEVS